MSKPKLIVLHGMGTHSAEQVKQTVIEAANSALHRYQRFETINFQDHVAVTGIGYDDIFEQERKRLTELNQSVSTYLSANGGVAPGFINKIVSLEQKIGEDNFFTTHALDVIFYLTLKGEEVRLRVIREVADVWANYNGEDVHVLGHSLGSAILHDTLHKAYTGGIDGHTLNCVTHKFKSLWMMSNVSNLTFSLSPFGIKFNPFDSIVRPSNSSDGCTKSFYNYWHKLDPFTLFHRFEPKNDESWLPMEIYEDSYSGKGISTIGSNLNPHELSEYISNPYVSYRFLKKIMPSNIFNPTLAEMHEANSKYKYFALEAQKIADYIGEIDSIDDIEQLVLATKDFKAYIKSLKDSLRG